MSEGFHQQYGGWHAERNAIMNLELRQLDSDNSPMLRQIDSRQLNDSTLYVNLEPCSHYGKTPPCADLIIERGIGRVVCCNDDPNPLVAGGGFAKLEAAGIEVTRHILEEEGRELNRRFFTYIEKKRPYVVLKWAESTDGYMAPAEKRKYWISSPHQTRMSHRLRTTEAAILVGSQTYIDDHPQLTPRHYAGQQPLRVVLDRRGRLVDVPEEWLRMRCHTLGEVMDELFRRKIQSLIVEGGRQVLDAFIDEGLYDEVVVFRGDEAFGEGLRAPAVPMPAAGRLHVI